MKDFGDRAKGRVVNENDDFRLIKPARVVSGTVRGVFPHSPKHVVIQTIAGQVFTIRVAA